MTIEYSKCLELQQGLSKESWDDLGSQSNLVDSAVGYTVQTFEAPELGVVFSYLTPIRK